MSIPFSQLPTIPDSDIRGITQLAAQTTDSNGVAYTGTVTVDQLFNDGGTGCVCVQLATLVIPSAQVLTLNTTPIAFGITVPTGYYVQPVGDIMMGATFVSAAYATNTNLRIRSVGGAQNYVSAVAPLAFSADIFIPLTKNVVTSGKAIDTGGDLEVYVPTGNPTAGDSPITIYLPYILIEA